jgi:hypothetical protein
MNPRELSDGQLGVKAVALRYAKDEAYQRMIDAKRRYELTVADLAEIEREQKRRQYLHG